MVMTETKTSLPFSVQVILCYFAIDFRKVTAVSAFCGEERRANHLTFVWKAGGLRRVIKNVSY